MIRMVRLVAVATLLFSETAFAQGTAVTALAECRLNVEEGLAELDKMPVLSEKDLSDYDAEEFDTVMNPATIRPFGLQASEFTSHYFYDGDYGELYYNSELSVGYDSAKQTILRSLGLSACYEEGENLAKTRTCKITPRGDGRPERLLVERKSGIVALGCYY